MINGRINLCKSHKRLSAWFSTPLEAWWLKKSIREGVGEVCRRGWRSWVPSAWRRPNCTWGELKTSTVCRGLERRQPRSSLNCDGQQTTAAGCSKEIFYQLEEKKPFAAGGIEHWNRLPWEPVESPSVEIVEPRLDKPWAARCGFEASPVGAGGAMRCPPEVTANLKCCAIQGERWQQERLTKKEKELTR